MAQVPGIDLSIMRDSAQGFSKAKRQDPTVDKGAAEFCPFNADHPGAAPFNPLFPYTGATAGLPGTGIGGVPVPAPGDVAHQYTPPGANDIRGPCPGMNTAANHNVGDSGV